VLVIFPFPVIIRPSLAGGIRSEVHLSTPDAESKRVDSARRTLR
jgi:hypothetical protein